MFYPGQLLVLLISSVSPVASLFFSSCGDLVTYYVEKQRSLIASLGQRSKDSGKPFPPQDSHLIGSLITSEESARECSTEADNYEKKLVKLNQTQSNYRA